jgi:hypothetical protein
MTTSLSLYHTHYNQDKQGKTKIIRTIGKCFEVGYTADWA